MVKSMSKEKQTFFNVTKGQISNFLRAVEHCASPGFNYCYAMQNVYTKDAWFVPCEYGYSYAVFGYCAFEYWIIKESETEGYYRISREELTDRLWDMIQEDYR